MGFEIALFVLGAAFVIISFFIVDNGNKESDNSDAQAEDSERADDIYERIVTRCSKEADIILQETEEKLKKLSNDKIIAVGEYSDQILEKISTNHNEVVFLYQMLIDKEEELKKTVKELDNCRIECEKLLKAVSEAKARYEKEKSAGDGVKREISIVRRTVPGISSIPMQGNSDSLQPDVSETSVPDTAEAFVPDAGEASVPGEGIMQSENAIEESQAQKPDVTNEIENQTLNESSDENSTEHTGETGKTAAAKVKTSGSTSTKKQTSGTRSAASTRSRSQTAASEKKRSSSGTLPAKDILPDISAGSPDTDMLSRNERIIEMHKSGKSVMEISKLLGMGQGEVKLIINLYCK